MINSRLHTRMHPRFLQEDASLSAYFDDLARRVLRFLYEEV